MDAPSSARCDGHHEMADSGPVVQEKRRRGGAKDFDVINVELALGPLGGFVIDRRQFGGARSVIAPAVGPVDGSPGMADGGSGDADTGNPGPTWTASEANLCEHAVRLRKRRGRYCLRRSCEGYDKASSSNQPDHSYPPFKELFPSGE
jgi:hypothetical protein